MVVLSIISESVVIARSRRPGGGSCAKYVDSSTPTVLSLLGGSGTYTAAAGGREKGFVGGREPTNRTSMIDYLAVHDNFTQVRGWQVSAPICGMGPRQRRYGAPAQYFGRVYLWLIATRGTMWRGTAT